VARQFSRGPTPFPWTDHFGICPQKHLVFEVQSITFDRLQALRFSSWRTVKTPRAASSNFKWRDTSPTHIFSLSNNLHPPSVFCNFCDSLLLGVSMHALIQAEDILSICCTLWLG